MLLKHIRAIHADSRGTYGWPRVHTELALGLGLPVNHNVPVEDAGQLAVLAEVDIAAAEVAVDKPGRDLLERQQRVQPLPSSVRPMGGRGGLRWLAVRVSVGEGVWSVRSVLRFREFRLLFAGLVASMVGDSLMLLVFGIWVKKLTGSSSAAGLVMVFVALPSVVAAFGGWVIDRFRRRPFLVAANLASTLTVLPLFAVRDRADVPLIFTCAALYGLSMVVTTSVVSGLLQQVVPSGLLAEANGALVTVREGLRLFGPLAGAALFTVFGGAAVAALDAISFVLAAVVIAFIRLDEPRPQRVQSGTLAEITAGIRHIGTDLALRRVAVSVVIAMLAIGMIESVSFALIDDGLGRPPEFMGVFSTAQGAGAVLGGVLAARLIRRGGELATIAVGFAAFGVGAVVCAAKVTIAVLGGIALAGIGLAISVVAMATVLQRRTPPRLISRTSIAMEMLYTAPWITSIAVGAALVAVLDYRVLLLAIGIGACLAGLIAWQGRNATRPSENPTYSNEPAPGPGQ